MARVTIQVGGLEAAQGRVSLAAFVEELQSVQAALNRADALASGRQQLATTFDIVRLSYSSPALIELEGRPRSDKSPDVREATTRIFGDALASVESGKLAESKIDYELLEQVRKIVEPIGKKVDSVAVSVDDHRYELVHTYVQRIDSALASTEFCEGSLDGMLEKMNIHLDANTFTLYPIVGPRSITCHFSRALKDRALAAMGHRVGVRGQLAYRKDAPFAHEINVNEIEIFERPEDLPKLTELRGRAPDATGDLSSEDFVAGLRDAW